MEEQEWVITGRAFWLGVALTQNPNGVTVREASNICHSSVEAARKLLERAASRAYDGYVLVQDTEDGQPYRWRLVNILRD